MGFIFTAILIVIFFAILVLGHEAGHFAAAKLLKLDVDEFGFGFPPKLIGKKWKGTEYTLNAIPFGGFVKIPALDPLSGKPSSVPAWKRIIVFSAGVVMNFLIGWVAFSIIFMVGAPKGVYIGAVLEDSPAEAAGIIKGDKLVGFESIAPVIDFISPNIGEEVSLNLERKGKVLSVNIIPEESEGIGRIGVELIESGFPREGFFKGIASGFTATTSFTGRIVGAFISMFKYREFSGGTGPIGIFSAVSVAKDMGLVYFLQLLGVVSLNLMIINIFPLPALDGGHILFVLIEKLRGKPLSKKVISKVNSASFALLLLLMFVVTIRDILRLF
ncbi:MAG: M50 family metallopeptidase [Candidatus Colwellbacteria bacterium]|nr:M50 family metallopeptidase [Candidatus Colwellbacteria bacterium]